METKLNAFASMLHLDKPHAQKDATMERTGRRMARNGNTQFPTEEKSYVSICERAGAYRAIAINFAVHVHGLVVHRIARRVWFH